MDHVWVFRADVYRADRDLGGFDVEATDGSIGSVDDDSTGSDYLIVDTGFWIFGKKRLLPAGVVTRVDDENEKVYVDMTKDEIKNAPDLDESIDPSEDDWDRDPYGTYYGPFVA